VRPRSQLLVQHLESVSRRVLEDFQDIIREYVRGRQGLYALYRRGKLQYVGLASDLRSRLRAHLRDRHAASWDAFSLFLTLGSDSLRELEALLIRIAKPRGNRSKTKFPRSQNLRGTFRRLIKRQQMAELDALFLTTAKDVRTGPGRKRNRNGSASLARFVTGRVLIRMKYKGRVHKARIKPDGWIRFRKKLFRSPSTAASAISGRPMNGWAWWTYERAPGDWVKLDELRH